MAVGLTFGQVLTHGPVVGGVTDSKIPPIWPLVVKFQKLPDGGTPAVASVTGQRPVRPTLLEPKLVEP
jgi:hypothetical protein